MVSNLFQNKPDLLILKPVLIGNVFPDSHSLIDPKTFLWFYSSLRDWIALDLSPPLGSENCPFFVCFWGAFFWQIWETTPETMSFRKIIRCFGRLLDDWSMYWEDGAQRDLSKPCGDLRTAITPVLFSLSKDVNCGYVKEIKNL